MIAGVVVGRVAAGRVAVIAGVVVGRVAAGRSRVAVIAGVATGRVAVIAGVVVDRVMAGVATKIVGYRTSDLHSYIKANTLLLTPSQ